ncbi:hypothetical protein GW17_00060081, partial [Ensete ventricosum]
RGPTRKRKQESYGGAARSGRGRSGKAEDAAAIEVWLTRVAGRMHLRLRLRRRRQREEDKEEGPTRGPSVAKESAAGQQRDRGGRDYVID